MTKEEQKRQAEEIRKIQKLQEDIKESNLDKISEEIYKKHMERLKKSGKND